MRCGSQLILTIDYLRCTMKYFGALILRKQIMLNKILNKLYDNKEERRLVKALLKPYFIYLIVTILLFLLCQLDMGAATKECGGGIMLGFLAHSFIMMFYAGVEDIRNGKD